MPSGATAGAGATDEVDVEAAGQRPAVVLHERWQPRGWGTAFHSTMRRPSDVHHVVSCRASWPLPASGAQGYGDGMTWHRGRPSRVLPASGRTRRLGAARVAAWLHDWLLMLLWMGVVTWLGFALGTSSWQLGHLVAASFITTADPAAVPVWVYAVTALLYPLMAVYLGSLFLGSGRTPYDLAAGTRVAPRTP